MNPLTQLKTTILPLLIALVLGCVTLLPSVRAAPDPAPPPPSNTRDGQGAMASITTGINNSAFGTNALNNLTIGNNNAAQGNSALFSLIDGGTNTALGVLALRLNVSGDNNTAVGYSALLNNLAADNTAVGWKALNNNTSGTLNTAVGSLALLDNVIGNFNTAIGFRALQNSISHSNTAVGYNAGLGITSGNSNTCLGRGAGSGVTTGTGNVLIGASAGFGLGAGSFNIYVGDPGSSSGGTFTEFNTIRIGSGQTRTFIDGIRGRTTGNNNAVPVVIDSAGQLGTTSSSRRFKKEIKAMEQASASILSLKPVTFHYKSDSTGTPQFGLIAEEVAQVNPDLVVRDENGEIYTVRYEAVNAMLLNEFLKEHLTVEELKSTAAKQEATIARQQKQIDALTTGLQKVSDQLKLSKAAPQVVNNP
jgi:hypothetical protein